MESMASGKARGQHSRAIGPSRWNPRPIPFGYVFPGGMLVSLDRLKEETAKVGLVWRQAEAFGQSYADTLAEWTRRFTAKWSDIRAMGFDDRFKQLWLFYLSYCEAGFRTGRTNVVQLALEKA